MRRPFGKWASELNFAERLYDVRERIEAAGGSEQVQIVAVTKGFGQDQIMEAVGAGLLDLGENYAQELIAKATVPNMPNDIRWHYLGLPQRNKIRRLVPHVFCWQGIGRIQEGEALSGVPSRGRVLVQVDFTTRRQGCTFEDAPRLVDELCKLDLDVRGLMTVAPPAESRITEELFAKLARLRNQLGLAELSMGMSGDFELAVKHGATMVRLGRALFGERPARVAKAFQN